MRTGPGRGEGRRGPNGRWSGRRAAGAVVLGVGILVASCSFVSGIESTDKALQGAGFTNPTVAIVSSPTSSEVTATVDAQPSAAGTRRSQLDSGAKLAARVVWQTLPGSFSELDVVLRGLGARTYTHAKLVALFGTRPPPLDNTALSSEVAGQSRTATVVEAVVVILLAAAVVVAFLLVRRARRRQRTAHGRLVMTTLPPEVWGASGLGDGQVPTWGAVVDPSDPPGSGPRILREGWPPPQPGFAPPPGPPAPADPSGVPAPVPPAPPVAPRAGGWPTTAPPAGAWPPPPKGPPHS